MEIWRRCFCYFLFRCNIWKGLFWIFLSVSLVSSTFYLSEVSHRDMTTSSTSLVNVNTVSTIHCAVFCKLESSCLSFSYNRLTRSCALYPSTNLNFDVTEPGSISFKKRSNDMKVITTAEVDSCDEIQERGYHNIKRDGVTYRVYCYVQSILVQARFIGGDNIFKTNITSYEQGFGDGKQENYWIGNEKLHNLTRGGEFMLHIQVITASEGYFADFGQFIVGSRDDKYVLTIGSLKHSDSSAFADLLMFNGMEFYVKGFGVPAPASDFFFGGGGWWKPNGGVTTCFNCFEIRFGSIQSISGTIMQITKKR